jgi:hypothetical protein
MSFLVPLLALSWTENPIPKNPWWVAKGANLKRGETLCECAKPGGDNKCNQGADGDKFQVCSWLQECHNAANKSFSFCIKKGNKVCARHQYLGTTGSIVKVKEHHPSKICCEEEACTSRQECIVKEGGTGTFEYEYDTSDGGTTKMKSWTLADIARNGWRNKKGEAVENKPRVCGDRNMDATVWARAVLAPAAAMIFILCLAPIMLFRVCKGCHKRPGACQDLTMPIIVIILSFFLTSSQGWVWALVTMLVAAANIATAADKKGKLVIFNILYAWLYYGGSNFFVQLGTITNPFIEVSTKSLDDIEAGCKTYFSNYYNIITAYKAWDMDDQATTWGLCDRNWLNFIISVQYAQALALFLMLTLSVYSYLSPGTSACTAWKKRGDKVGATATANSVDPVPPTMGVPVD